MDDQLHYFKMAKRINDENHDLFLKENDEVHLRGNLKSMSLISINRDKPELGFSAITKEETVFQKMEKLKLKDIPQRSTPEKSLQSYIIKHALLSNYVLPFGKNIKFVTSEIAIIKDNKRIVNDILGFDQDNQLCIIELKSDRHMTRLKEQVDNFENVVKDEAYIEFFYSLLELYGHKWDKESIQKIIVWPSAKGNGKKFKDSHDNSIVEFEYDKDKLDREYVLEIYEVN